MCAEACPGLLQPHPFPSALQKRDPEEIERIVQENNELKRQIAGGGVRCVRGGLLRSLRSGRRGTSRMHLLGGQVGRGATNALTGWRLIASYSPPRNKTYNACRAHAAVPHWPPPRL